MTGSSEIALGAALMLFGGLLIERVLLSIRLTAYYTWSIPLDEVLVPIPEAPEGAGRTPTVDWEVVGDDLVRWWAPTGRGTAPFGLHGSVALTRRRHDVALIVRWAPPWTPLIGSLWMVALGLLRGEWIGIPIGIGLFGVILYAYRLAAVRAAAELRYSFVRGAEGDPPAVD